MSATTRTAWYREIGIEQKRTLIAATLGWMLDSMDVQLYALILIDVMGALKLDPTQGGWIATCTILSSSFGGAILGIVADRLGRTRAMIISTLLYSVFTFSCGISQTFVQLAVCRIIVGFGLGGEWSAGAALITETWPAAHRGKALGIMQSAWAAGLGLAALVTAIVLPTFGWRSVFFVGILPAVITLWIRWKIPEPEAWTESKKDKDNLGTVQGLREIMTGPSRRIAIVLTLMNVFAMVGYWALFTWIPSYLKMPLAKGGVGLSVVEASIWIMVLTVGQWIGYIAFGFIADAIGTKKTYCIYFVAASILVPIYGLSRDPTVLLVIGPLLGFFGSGFFSGFASVTTEIFPTKILGTAQGLAFNVGRATGAFAPAIVGSLSKSHGLGKALLAVGAAYFGAAILASLLPSFKRSSIPAR